MGDSIGLPYEGLSPDRGAKLLGPPDRQRLLFGGGMISDDTEHTCMVAQSLINSVDRPGSFGKELARRFRWWLTRIPAGIGMATLRSIIRLWFGVSPDRSGVFSAGNGPAMRASILGAILDDREQIRSLNRVSARITHSDPKAEFGALAIALAASMARQQDLVHADEFAAELRTLLDQEGAELIELIDQVAASVKAAESTPTFAASLGLEKGVTGYVYHSVPVAIHAWLAHQNDFRAAIVALVECGGDTDSTAAMTGGIVGCGLGEEGIPTDWLDQLWEWPCSLTFMRRLGGQLFETFHEDRRDRSVELPVSGQILRNGWFLLLVLYHGFRRLLPPY